jgi:hypothetical protein
LNAPNVEASTAWSAAFRPAAVRLWSVLLLSVVAIPVVWRVVEWAGITGYERYRYTGWSVVVAPAMLYAWGADYLLRPLVFRSADRTAGRLLGFSMALIPLAVLYALIGLAAGSPLRFLAGDTFKYLLTPFGFYLAATSVHSVAHARWLLRALAVFGFYPGLDLGGHLFPLGYVYGRKVVYWRRYSWLLILPLVYLTIRWNRTSLLLVPLMTVALYYYARRFRLWQMGAALVAFGALAWGLYRVVPGLFTSTGAYQKTVYMLKNLTLEDYRRLDLSTYQRLQEAVLVAEKFQNASWVERTLGFGSGAVFRVAELPPSEQAMLEEVQGGFAHHIHLSPVFVYHQWGLPGLVLLAYSALALAALGWRLGRRRRDGADPERQEGYSLQIAGFLMAAAFFLYGGWNPPKISLFYFGMVLGCLWWLLGSTVEPAPPRRMSVPASGLGVAAAAAD